jgi:hypothetical protein
VRTFQEGQLVALVEEGGTLDGVVVHVQSLVRIEVAVADDERGPVFRIVHPKTLRERGTAGEHDDALHRLIRRTQSAGRAGPRSGPGAVRGRRGHGSVSGHRTTGK